MRIQLQGEEDEEDERRKREQDAEEKRSVARRTPCMPTAQPLTVHFTGFRCSAQNQLPSWIANSTISGEASSRQLELQAKQEAANGHFPSSTSNPSYDPLSAAALDIKPDSALLASEAAPEAEDDLEAYYATLAAEEEQGAIQAGGAGADSATAAPSSTVASPMMASSVGTPVGASVEDEEEAAAALELQLGQAQQDEAATANAKRAREESAEGMQGVELTGGYKKSRLSGSDTVASSLPPASEGTAADELDDGEFDDEDEDEEMDPNPMVSVAGKEVPFLDITKDMQDAMTPEEYEKYFSIYALIGE